MARNHLRKSQEQIEMEWAAQDAAFFTEVGVDGWGRASASASAASRNASDGRQPAGSGRYGGVRVKNSPRSSPPSSRNGSATAAAGTTPPSAASSTRRAATATATATATAGDGLNMSDEELARRLQERFMNGLDSCSFNSSLFSNNSSSMPPLSHPSPSPPSYDQSVVTPHRHSIADDLTRRRRQKQEAKDEELARRMQRGEWDGNASSLTASMRDDDLFADEDVQLTQGDWNSATLAATPPSTTTTTTTTTTPSNSKTASASPEIPPPPAPAAAPPVRRGIHREANIRQHHPLRRSINDFRSSSSSLLGGWLPSGLSDSASPTAAPEEGTSSSRPLLARSLSSRDTGSSRQMDNNSTPSPHYKQQQQQLVSDESWKQLINRSTPPPCQPLPGAVSSSPSSSQNHHTAASSSSSAQGKTKKKGGSAASMLRTALGIGSSSSSSSSNGGGTNNHVSSSLNQNNTLGSSNHTSSSSTSSSTTQSKKTRSVTPPRRRGGTVAHHANMNANVNVNVNVNANVNGRSRTPTPTTSGRKSPQQASPSPTANPPPAAPPAGPAGLLAAIASQQANNQHHSSNSSTSNPNGRRRATPNLIPERPTAMGQRATTVPMPPRGRASPTSAEDGAGLIGAIEQQHQHQHQHHPRNIRGNDELGGSFRATVSGVEATATPSFEEFSSAGGGGGVGRGNGRRYSNPNPRNTTTTTTNNNNNNSNNNHKSRHKNNVCDECHRPATSYLLALGKKYHRHCFRCMGCHEVIDHTQPFTFTEVEGRGLNERGLPNTEKHPLHRQCYSELFGMKCTICNSTIPSQSNGRISYMKHPFFEKEIMCPHHANDETKRCSGCHRFEPSFGNGFADLGDGGRCVCYSCCRSVVVDNEDAKPLWARVLQFFATTLQLPVWEGMKQVPILIVGHDTLNEQSAHSNHSDSAQIMTRGLCLTEHSRGSRIGLMPRMRFDQWSRSFTKKIESAGGGGGGGGPNSPRAKAAEDQVTYFTIPKANEANEKSSITAILCLSGLPSDLTASILAHEATHAWLKLHPDYVFDRPIPAQVEEGVCQLVAHLFLTDGLDVPSTQPSPDGGPSDEKLRQYFKFSIETDVNEIYGDGFRKASKAYSEIGIELLLSHIVLYRNFPEL